VNPDQLAFDLMIGILDSPTDQLLTDRLADRRQLPHAGAARLLRELVVRGIPRKR
jgi:hypothetical protein